MNLKVRLLVIPSLLAAGLLGACGPQEADQDVPAEPGVVQDEAGIVEPEVDEAGDIDVAEGEPGVLENEEGVAEGETGVLEDEEGLAEVEPNVLENEEGVAEGETGVLEDEEGLAEGETGVLEDEEGLAGAETMPGTETLDMTSAVKASEIIGYDVENLADEDLGDIEDLLVDVNTGQVRYAVLSFGGFLDIGDKLFAIPLNAINFNAEDQAFIFDVTEERLENAPGFEQNNWPDFADPEWDMGAEGYWLESAEDAAAAGDATLQNPEEIASGQVIRASELLDYDIHNAQNEEIGEVEDLIVPMNNQTQQVAYAVLSLDDMFEDATLTDDTVAEGDTVTEGDTVAEGDAVAEGDTVVEEDLAAVAPEERLYAVPVNQLTLGQPEDEFFVFSADPQMLDTALSFSPDEWSQLMNLEEDIN